MELELTYHAVQRYIKRIEPDLSYEEALEKLNANIRKAFMLRENSIKGHMQFEFPRLNCIGIVKRQEDRKIGIVVTIIEKVHHNDDDTINHFDHELMEEYADDIIDKLEKLRSLSKVVEKFYSNGSRRPWDGMIKPDFESLSKLQLHLVRLMAAIKNGLPDPGPDGEIVPANVRKNKLRLIEAMAGALYIHREKDYGIPVILEKALKVFSIDRKSLPSAARKYIGQRPDAAARVTALNVIEEPVPSKFKKLISCMLHQLGSKDKIEAMLLVERERIDAWLETGEASVEVMREVAVKVLNEMTDVIEYDG